jgi:hypothetical protein
MTVKKKKYVKEALDYLLPLAKLPLKTRIKLIPLLSDTCIHKICEGCRNLLDNTADFDDKSIKKIRKKLQSSKNDIRCLARPSTSLLRKRKLLAKNQTGRGVFSILASIIVPALLGALTR